MVQDDLRIRYKTMGDHERQQGKYYEDREEHVGHLLSNCSANFQMRVKLAGEIGVKIIPGLERRHVLVGCG